MGSITNERGSPDCLGYYARCLEINPNSYLSHNGLGNHYLKTGQFEKARDSYDRAAAIDPKRSAKIYKNRAFVNGELGRDQEAKADLKLYLKHFPRAPDRGVIERAIREL